MPPSPRSRLGANALNGTLPPSWGGLAVLRSLHAETNGLGGALPAEWSALAKLQELGLGGNRLAGSIPAGWGQGMSSLRFLDLQGNPDLCGPLPDGLLQGGVPSPGGTAGGAGNASQAGGGVNASAPSPGVQLLPGGGGVLESEATQLGGECPAVGGASASSLQLFISAGASCLGTILVGGGVAMGVTALNRRRQAAALAAARASPSRNRSSAGGGASVREPAMVGRAASQASQVAFPESLRQSSRAVQQQSGLSFLMTSRLRSAIGAAAMMMSTNPPPGPAAGTGTQPPSSARHRRASADPSPTRFGPPAPHSATTASPQHAQGGRLSLDYWQEDWQEQVVLRGAHVLHPGQHPYGSHAGGPMAGGAGHAGRAAAAPPQHYGAAEAGGGPRRPRRLSLAEGATALGSFSRMVGSFVRPRASASGVPLPSHPQQRREQQQQQARRPSRGSYGGGGGGYGSGGGCGGGGGLAPVPSLDEDTVTAAALYQALLLADDTASALQQRQVLLQQQQMEEPYQEKEQQHAEQPARPRSMRIASNPLYVQPDPAQPPRASGALEGDGGSGAHDGGGGRLQPRASAALASSVGGDGGPAAPMMGASGRPAHLEQPPPALEAAPTFKLLSMDSRTRAGAVSPARMQAGGRRPRAASASAAAAAGQEEEITEQQEAAEEEEEEKGEEEGGPEMRGGGDGGEAAFSSQVHGIGSCRWWRARSRSAGAVLCRRDAA
ncbi:putative inactive receptor kinase At4g23740-like protein [Tetrabaena socialis]|uniref:Putative inactive receptor kinase At4g23740-like protein n=1 Tax=Tetrabaena socialis TaxID=47790 RepID=A0A2J7ZVG6_9CHLO|nr:putative inactive receptor kinase At4g23740-like protein [Tetrabaena socialis]|eukprot:PNH04277.1 putative inactive receptor kinase At4g23740-like protein [Tetrabaena socialis]